MVGFLVTLIAFRCLLPHSLPPPTRFRCRGGVPSHFYYPPLLASHSLPPPPSPHGASRWEYAFLQICYEPADTVDLISLCEAYEAFLGSPPADVNVDVFDEGTLGNSRGRDARCDVALGDAWSLSIN